MARKLQKAQLRETRYYPLCVRDIFTLNRAFPKLILYFISLRHTRSLPIRLTEVLLPVRSFLPDILYQNTFRKSD